MVLYTVNQFCTYLVQLTRSVPLHGKTIPQIRKTDWNLGKNWDGKLNKSPQFTWVSCFSCPRTLPFAFDTLVAAIISVISKLKCYFAEKVWEICQNCHSCEKFWLGSVSIFWAKWFVETKTPDTRFINVFPQYQANRKKIMIQRGVFETQWFSDYP